MTSVLNKINANKTMFIFLTLARYVYCYNLVVQLFRASVIEIENCVCSEKIALNGV